MFLFFFIKEGTDSYKRNNKLENVNDFYLYLVRFEQAGSQITKS